MATLLSLHETTAGIDPDPRLAVRYVIRNFYITVWQMSKSRHGMKASTESGKAVDVTDVQSLCFPGLNKTSCRVCSAVAAYSQMGSLIFILLSWNLTLELLLCVLSTGGKLFISDFKIFFWLIHFDCFYHQCNSKPVTCNKILPSPGSSYSAPAKLSIGILEKKKPKPKPDECGIWRSQDPRNDVLYHEKCLKILYKLGLFYSLCKIMVFPKPVLNMRFLHEIIINIDSISR